MKFYQLEVLKENVSAEANRLAQAESEHLMMYTRYG